MPQTARVTKRHSITHARNLFHGQAQHPGANGGERGVPMNPIVQIDLGVPVAASANAICLSQSINTGTPALLNGATAGVLDVPRNVVAAWTGTAVLTVTGTDEFGAVVVESSASGTSFTGKKAFKSITSVTVSANVTLATVGTGAVLGLPYRVGFRADILAIYQEATLENASTVVVGDANTATATTGDVRGTVSPTTAPDGAKRYKVWYKIHDPDTRAGAFGVDQFAG